jgi:hypothetical protein
MAAWLQETKEMKHKILNLLSKIPIRVIKVSTLKRMSEARSVGNQVLQRLLDDNHFLRTQLEEKLRGEKHQGRYRKPLA